MLGPSSYPTIRAGLFGNRATSKIMSVVVALVLLALSVSAFAAAQSTTQYAVHEPLSGTSFPVSLTPPGGATPHWITGVALRQRTIFQVNIYAFGLYVDAEGARESLSRFTGMSASMLETDGSFYQQLLDLDFAMTLRLVMLRAVDGDDLAEAFEEVLRPRLAGVVPSMDGPKEGGVLGRFRDYFDVEVVEAGTEIAFSCGPAGRLIISVGRAAHPVLDSLDLCRALFDVYLGVDPISWEGKRNVIAGFPELLAAEDRNLAR